TGADAVFITRDPDRVEEDRLLPLATAEDTKTGTLTWSGKYLVNPWDEGQLVDLGRFPRLESYLRRHQTRLRGRHVAKRRPGSWYRTIDRIDPDLLARPKLLVPDIK